MVKMTKKNMGLLSNYEWALGRYGIRGLWDCYTNASVYKHIAYDSCVRDKFAMNGYDGTIVGYNCMQFTYAFKYDLVDELTGELCTYLRYYTKDNTYNFRIA